MRGLTWKSFLGDMQGGMVGALITIPIILSCGVISYQNIGHEYLTLGIAAAFISCVIATLLAGIFGKSPLHINSPKTTHAAILSGFIATISTSHLFISSVTPENAAQTLIAICLLTLAISGVTQILIGGFKLGALVKFIPYPVLAGFINGFALQIILNQLPKVFGLDKEKDLINLLIGNHYFNYWTVLASIFTISLMMCIKKIKLVPPALIALGVGTVLQIIIQKMYPQLHLGRVIGEIPRGIPIHLHIGAMSHIVFSHLFVELFIPIMVTGVTLAFISSIQSLLSISATEHLFDAKHNSNKELVIQGASNLLSAVLGGTPSGGSPNTTQVVFANGGRTGLASIMFALTIILITYAFNFLIELIPLSVMASVVIVTTITAIDKWTKQLFIHIGSSDTKSSKKDILMNLVVVILVTAFVIFSSVIIALGVGLIGVVAAFLYRSNLRMIRRTLYANHFHSRTEREHAHMSILEQEGHRISIVELDGPIFFGSSESIYKYIDKKLATIDWLILDLKRVSHMDSSGVMVIKRLDEQMKKDKKVLFLSYLPELGNRRRFLYDLGYTKAEKENRIYTTTDMALSDAEEALIQKTLHLDNVILEVNIDKFYGLQHLNSEQLGRVVNVMREFEFKVGDDLISHNTFENQLLFLKKGKINVYCHYNGEKIRTASYMAGMSLGEVALHHAKQTKQFIAQSDVTVLVLNMETLDNKDIENIILKNLVEELSYKVIELHDVILELEEN